MQRGRREMIADEMCRPNIPRGQVPKPSHHDEEGMRVSLDQS